MVIQEKKTLFKNLAPIGAFYFPNTKIIYVWYADFVFMIIRDFQKNDKRGVEEIFALYWTDSGFLKKLSEKLEMCISQTQEYINKQYRFFVAEENNEIVGIVITRKAPEAMKLYAQTENPAELYVIASKYKHKGIGKELRMKALEEVKKLGFTEMVFYSPDSHKESWSFHNQLGFERVPGVVSFDEEPGGIWRKIQTNQ